MIRNSRQYVLNCDLSYLYTRRYNQAKSLGLGTPRAYGKVAGQRIAETPAFVQRVFFAVNNEVTLAEPC